MGVDGIGKGGPAGPGGIEPAIRKSTEPHPTEEAFSIDAARGADAPEAPTPLEQVQRGEISVEEYLDVRVEGAVRHLDGRLQPAELDFVKQTLREQLSADPVLVELVRRTTGGPAPGGSRD